ncbi:MAG: hypothetical protein AAF728_00540 [Cyanobacteria bacterium P01_D01_bin.128]
MPNAPSHRPSPQMPPFRRPKVGSKGAPSSFQSPKAVSLSGTKALPRKLFSGGQFIAGPNRALKPAFWHYLLRDRPLWLLGGLWSVCVLISMGAVVGLLDPGVEVQPPPPAAAPTQTATQIETGSVTREDNTDVQTTALHPEVDARLGFGNILALVAGCSGGCWLLSRYFQRPRRPYAASHNSASRSKNGQTPAVTQPASPTEASSTAAKPGAASSSAIKRLKPFQLDLAESLYDSDREPAPDPTYQTSADQTSADQTSAHQAPAHQTLARQTTERQSPDPEPNPAAAQVAAQVVSPQQTHALDWPEGSVAHNMDLRQRRSLSSFL